MTPGARRAISTPTLLIAAALLVLTACGGPDESASGTGSSGHGGSAASGTGAGGGASTSSTSGAGGMMTGVPPGAPIVFYTDLVSAPPGAYVTMWGHGFGDPQGASTATLAGAPLAVLSWSATKIEVKLPADAKSGDLVVHTDAGDSPPMPLAVHTGNLYFVADSGDDGFSGKLEAPTGGDGPFQSLGRGRDALQPGDVLYLRANTFTAEDQFSAILSFYDVPPASEAAPMAIVAYPGETVTLGDGSLQRGLSFYTGDSGPRLTHLTIAKLVFHPSCDAVEIINADDGRFVGNEVGGATDACQNGVVESQGTSGWKILGNWLHDNGNTKLEHGIYLGGYGTQKDFEIAYNRIENQKGGRGIQLYGHQTQDHIENVSIHDNEITDIDRDGIVLGATDADVLTLTNIVIYDNIFVRAGRCVGSGVRVGNDTATVTIFNNTFVDNGAGNVACDQSGGESQGQILVEASASVEIRNNLLAAAAGETYADVQAAMGLVGANNLFSGGGGPDAWDTAPVSGDPMFVSAANGDYHVAASSAAVDHGTAVAVSRDHDGVSRPQGVAFDIGAYENAP